MEEQKIEKYLKNKVEKLGGKALKFTSPNMVGVPDRIVLLPGARIVFIELKAEGRTISPIQAFRHKEIKNLGFEVLVIDSKDMVDNFVRSVKL